MGDFTKRIQSDKVPGPLRRNFTPEGWRQEFDSHGAADDKDKNVYAVALAIHQKLQNIRARLQLSTSPKLTATTKLRAMVAAVNYNFLLSRDKSQVEVAKVGAKRAEEAPEGFPAEELTAVKLKLRGGFEWSPAEIVESLVDGIEIPVRFALAGSPDLAGQARMEQVEWSDISLELNLGILYRHAEDLWHDCLWNGYKLIDAGRMKVFMPTEDVDAQRGYRMGLARRLSLAIGFTVIATRAHRELVARGLIPPAREVSSIGRQGKRQTIAVKLLDEPTSEQEDFMVSRTLASEPYYAELLKEPLQALSALSVQQLLNAWNVVARASALLIEDVKRRAAKPLKEDSPAHSWLPDYVPVLQTEALANAVSTALVVARPEAKRLIEFLIFRGKDGQEIWAQPLVPVGPNTVAPVFAATAVPNLRRLVDVWLRQLGVDLSRRGPAFEAHLRDLVDQGIKGSKLLSNHAKCVTSDYTFKPSGSRQEQIDLILVVGSTVVVAEAKCILEPTESKAVAMHRRTVLVAAEQAKRKSTALAAHRAEFVRDMKQHGIDLPETFKVVPLVVVSTTTHVGVHADGVPVTDEYILGRFLDGEYEHAGVSGEDLAIRKTLKTIFYADAAEAEARMGNYFSEPPQMARFKADLRGRMLPIHAIDEKDWEGTVLTLECVPGSGAAKAVPAA